MVRPMFKKADLVHTKDHKGGACRHDQHIGILQSLESGVGQQDSIGSKRVRPVADNVVINDSIWL